MRYRTIYADPPWSYANWTDARGHGAASSAMRTVPTEDLAAIPVERWAERDAVLLMWATWPKLPDALVLADAWGFNSYVTGAPWIKTAPRTGDLHPGTGFWWLGASEILLAFRRGRARAPSIRGTLGLLEGAERTWWSPRLRPHSRKPLALMDWIQAALPGPYLELFARGTAPGWTSWGLDTGWELGPWGVRPAERAEPEPGLEPEPEPEPDQRGLFS